MAVPNTLKCHCVKACRMNEISVSSIWWRLSVVEIYSASEIDDEYDIISTNGDEIDICVDNENSANFFIGTWVLVIYEGNCYPGEIKLLQSKEREVTIMHPSRKYSKWPNQEGKTYYLKNNMLKNITPPQNVSLRGHLMFKEL